jgi:hypothetical protein
MSDPASSTIKGLVRAAIVGCSLFIALGVTGFGLLYLAPTQIFSSAVPELTVSKIAALTDIEQLRNVTMLLVTDRARLGSDVSNLLSNLLLVLAWLCVLAAGFGAMLTVTAVIAHRQASGRPLGWLRHFLVGRDA